MATVLLWFMTVAIFCSIGCSWQKTSESQMMRHEWNGTVQNISKHSYTTIDLHNDAIELPEEFRAQRQASSNANQPTFARLKRSSTSTNSNEPISSSYWAIRLLVIADFGLYTHFNENTAQIEQFIREMIRDLQGYFDLLEPAIQIEYELTTWNRQESFSNESKINGNITQLIIDFIRSVYTPEYNRLVDHTMLVSGYNLSGVTKGTAYTESLCRPDTRRLSISVINSLERDNVGRIAAHELGHSIGMEHDGLQNFSESYDQNSSKQFERHCASWKYGIMYPYLTTSNNITWSSCSRRRFQDQISVWNSSRSNCLIKRPNCNGTVTFGSRLVMNTNINFFDSIDHACTKTPHPEDLFQYNEYFGTGQQKTLYMTAGEQYSCRCVTDYSTVTSRMAIAGTNGSEIQYRTASRPLHTSAEGKFYEYRVTCDPVSLVYQYESIGQNRLTTNQWMFIDCIGESNESALNHLEQGPKCNGNVTFGSRAEDRGVHHYCWDTPYGTIHVIPGYPESFRMSTGERYLCVCAVNYDYFNARLEISGTNGSQIHNRTFPLHPSAEDDMRSVDYFVTCNPVSLTYEYESKDGHRFTWNQWMQINCNDGSDEREPQNCVGNVTFRSLVGTNEATDNYLVENLCAVNQPHGSQIDIFSPESVQIVPGDTYYCTCIVNYHNNARGELVTSDLAPVYDLSGRIIHYNYANRQTHNLKPNALNAANVPYIVKCNPNTGNYEYSVDYKHNGTADVFSCIYHSAQ